MICQPKSQTRIFVVDGCPNDYANVVDASVFNSFRFKFFGAGCDALRVNPDEEPEMWVVNMQLSDMPGTDLFGLLRSRGSSVPILLVGDQYRVEDEVNARTSGAAMYFAKPLQSEWLLSSATQVA